MVSGLQKPEKTCVYVYLRAADRAQAPTADEAYSIVRPRPTLLSAP